MDCRGGQRAVVLWCVGLLLVPSARAELTCADVFTDHMVLQRDKPVPVWGWARPGQEVTVRFAGRQSSAVADERGRWQAVLAPLKLSTKPRTMTVSVAGAGQPVTFEDVLVGDVWLCSGQSNMGRDVNRSILPKGMRWEHSQIRYWGAGKSERYPVERFAAREDRPEGPRWRVCGNEESTRKCCAVGFFFARRVQQDVRVPIGLLWQAWAGSIIQEWVPPRAWRREPSLADLADKVDGWFPDTPHGRAVWKQRLAEIGTWLDKAETSLNQGTPFPFPQPRMPEPGERDVCGFYNGKIHPIVPFAVKGVLWYQGESDQRNARWAVMLKALAASWRDAFDLDGAGENIPFYWMQIQRSGDYCSPLVRQQQLRALKLVPNSGMAVLLDLDVNVHPANKVDSGVRLALWALNRDYGRKDVVPSGPLYRRHRAEGDKVIVEFDYAEGGLRVGQKDLLNEPTLRDAGELPNVELAGKDKRWHAARTRLDGKRLVARSDRVAEPLHVRYCYKNIPDPPFLYGAAGLPAAAFTTLEQ